MDELLSLFAQKRFLFTGRLDVRGSDGIVNLTAQGRNGAAIQSRGFTPQAHTTSCHTENARDRKIR